MSSNDTSSESLESKSESSASSDSSGHDDCDSSLEETEDCYDEVLGADNFTVTLELPVS